MSLSFKKDTDDEELRRPSVVFSLSQVAEIKSKESSAFCSTIVSFSYCFCYVVCVCLTNLLLG